MGFDVAAEAYGAFMGRFSEPLAEPFLALAAARAGQRGLDVGAGPGALTARMVALLGADAVAAVDPSPSFVAALRTRLPGVDVREASADPLPFTTDAFDVTLAQLVVHFLPDPVAGLAEMARVTTPGGVVGASVWDFAGGRGPTSLLWRAAQDLDPAVVNESGLAGARGGDLERLLRDAGLREVRGTTITVAADHADAAAWWHPYTLGVGPAGAYVAALPPEHREALRLRCAELLPEGPGRITATAWVGIGTV